MPNRLSAQQENNAMLIIRIGRDMGMSSRDIQIGLMTAMQESSLKNLRGGDRDSAGLFQQRPSQGWGSYSQVTNPEYSTKTFFNRLKNVGNRSGMPLWQAAQTVQRSANPRAYERWEGMAGNLLQEISGFSSGPGDNPNAYIEGVGNVRLDDQGDIEKVFSNAADLDMMQQFVGQNIGDGVTTPEVDEDLLTEMAEDPDAPVVDNLQSVTSEISPGEDQMPGGDPAGVGDVTDWENFDPLGAVRASELTGEDAKQWDQFLSSGSGGQNSPLSGQRQQALQIAKQYLGTPYKWGGAAPGGFDCSGLIQYALNQLGVNAPRLAYQQARWGEQTSLKNIKPGDLVFWGNSQRTQGNHIAFYLGNGRILEAPKPGLSVRTRTLREDEGAIGIKIPY